MEVQWNNIKKCALGNTKDLVVEVDRKARKPWITLERISKMDERKQWEKVNDEEGRWTTEDWGKNWKTGKDKPKKEYLRAYVTISWDFKEQEVTI